MSTINSNKCCRNCDSQMAHDDKFCRSCGQKYHTGKISLGSLLSSFFSDVFNINSKIYRSIWALFIPGKLTTEFFEGRHKSFAPPIRIFIVSSIVFAIGLSSLIPKGKLLEQEYKDLSIVIRSDINSKIDSVQIGLESHFNNSQTSSIIDSLQSEIFNQGSSNKYMLLMEFDKISFKLNKKVPFSEVYKLSDEAILKKYEVTGFLDQLMAKQQIKMMKDPSSFINYIFSRTTVISLLMMPIVGLILKLLYIRRNRYYVEHLIYSLHLHSFGFLLLGVVTYFWGFSFYKIGLSILSLLILIYLYISLKKVYKQSKFKTISKVFLLLFLYMISFSFFVVFASIISILIF